MIEFRPFRALHYDANVAGPLADVIAPPYDVIDAAELERLYARSPLNVVRLILNTAPDRYAASAAALEDWRARGVLVQDREPALYWYVQDFALADGSRHQRSGLLAAVRLQPFSNGNILPHERTFASAKADRLKLMQACRANLSPIFGVYPNRAAAAAPARALASSTAPWIDVEEGGQRHRVWRVRDAAAIDQIIAALRDSKLFIADGHHRYETALTYRDQRHAAGDTAPDAPHNFMLMYLCSMDDPGLVVLPTHRLWRGAFGEAALERAAAHFTFEAADAATVLARLAAAREPGCIGVRTPTRTGVLRLRDLAAVDRALPAIQPIIRHLDVTVLDGFLLGHVLGIDCGRAGQDGELLYTHDDRQALQAVERDGVSAAFLLRRPRMSEVADACLAGQVMPQKSTYFFPKLQTGLVFHLLDPDA
ncbi:DUF1015 domain-containing protein [bacterium]|nr:DUF1015 domain-containing protein [bacterium]